jgi:hypothetical protein
MSDVAGSGPFSLRGASPVSESVAERFFKRVLNAAERLQGDRLDVTVDTVMSAFPDDEKWPRDRVALLLEEPKFLAAAAARGISLRRGGLSSEQMDAIVAYFNAGGEGFHHQRRLLAIGVTQTKWRAWNQQPEFRAEVRRRAEQDLEFASTVTARQSLASLVEKEDLGAIKFSLQMSGEYDPNKPQVDMARVLNELLALLDEHAAELPAGFMTKFATRLQNTLAVESVRTSALPPSRGE